MKRTPRGQLNRRVAILERVDGAKDAYGVAAVTWRVVALIAPFRTFA
jgi:DNA-binding transcriptional regulator YbjK